MTPSLAKDAPDHNCIVLYSFIVQVDRTQLILHTNSFAYIVYKVPVFGYIDCTYVMFCSKR